MDLRRRNMLAALAATLGAATPLQSLAQSAGFPDRPVKIIVPGQPGTIMDIYARRYAPHLSELLGQQIVIDNKPGASGSLAMDAALRAPADGYTLAFGAHGESGLTRALGMPYPDVEALTTPVALLAVNGSYLLGFGGLGVKNMAELSQYLKAQSKPLSIGIPGLGTGQHVLSAMLIKVTGHPFELVPYKGSGAALPDLANGIIQLAFGTALEAQPFVQAGKAVVLANTVDSRSPLLPNVSSMREQGFPTVSGVGYIAAFVHKDVPEPVRQKLHDAFNKVSVIPDVQEKRKLGGSSLPELSLPEVRSFIKETVGNWISMARETNVKYSP